MNFFSLIDRLIVRLRHPVSLPEEITHALGVEMKKNARPVEIIQTIQASPHALNLRKFMPREQAEGVFASALRKERFLVNSLFSYYMKDGWISFYLHFDQEERLRRVIIHHKTTEVPLPLCG